MAGNRTLCARDGSRPQTQSGGAFLSPLLILKMRFFLSCLKTAWELSGTRGSGSVYNPFLCFRKGSSFRVEASHEEPKLGPEDGGREGEGEDSQAASSRLCCIVSLFSGYELS